MNNDMKHKADDAWRAEEDDQTPEDEPLKVWPFFAVALAWFLALNITWVQVVPVMAYPGGLTASAVLGVVAPQWVQKAELKNGELLVDTSFKKMVPDAQGKPTEQFISVDVQARGMTYGMTLFLALIISAARSGWWLRIWPGIALLMVVQGFCMAGAALSLAVRAVGSAAALGITPWQFNAFNVLYFQCVLVLPTLAPVMVWLWLDWPVVARLFGLKK